MLTFQQNGHGKALKRCGAEGNMEDALGDYIMRIQRQVRDII